MLKTKKNLESKLNTALLEDEIDATWKVMGMTGEFLTNLPETLQKNLITSLAKQGYSFEDSNGENMMSEILEIPRQIAEHIQSIEWIPDLFGHKIHLRLEGVKQKLKAEDMQPLKLLKTILIPINAKSLEMIERTCSFPDYLGTIKYGEGTLLKDIEEFLGLISQNVPYQVLKEMEKRVKNFKSGKWNALFEIKKMIKESSFGRKVNTKRISDKVYQDADHSTGKEDFCTQVQLQDRLEIEFLEAAASKKSIDEVAKKALLYIMGQLALMYNGLTAQLPISFKESDIEKDFGKNETERAKRVLEIYIRCLGAIEQLKRMERYLP